MIEFPEERPVFIVTLADQTTCPPGVTTYMTRNWEVRVDNNQMHFIGDFVRSTSAGNEWSAIVSQRAGWVITVRLGGQRDGELMQEAEDHKRVERLSAHLAGLTEKLIDSNLSQEFKEILKRTPATMSAIGASLTEGLKNALDKLGKGK